MPLYRALLDIQFPAENEEDAYEVLSKMSNDQIIACSSNELYTDIEEIVDCGGTIGVRLAVSV